MSIAAPPEGLPTPNRLMIVTLLMIDPKRSLSPEEIETATGLSRQVVRRALEALHDARRLVKIPGLRRTYRVRLTSSGVEQCAAWMAKYGTPKLITEMCQMPQGRLIVGAYTVRALVDAFRRSRR